MKYLWLLGLLGVGQFASAQANDMTILDTMTCVRTIAENKLGGRDGLSEAAGFIDALTSGEDLSSSCEDFVNSSRAIRISRKQQIEFLNSEPSISAKARSVLTTTPITLVPLPSPKLAISPYQQTRWTTSSRSSN